MKVNKEPVNLKEEKKLTADELGQVSGGADNGGVILVGTGKEYPCPEPGCNCSFDTQEELNRHSNMHYHAVI